MRVERRVKMSQPLMVEVPEEAAAPIRHRNEIQIMLDEAIGRRDAWLHHWDKTKLSKKDNIEALRNYTALRGVVKTLRWVMLNPNIEHPLD
jgi:hypothetical protein